MSCEEYLENFTRIMSQQPIDNATAHASAGERAYLFVHRYVYGMALPAICAFGILGNVLNLVVLTRKQLQKSMDRMEKSAHLGLVALAVTDMIFCVVTLPVPFVPNKFLYTDLDSQPLVYLEMYNQCLVNIFLLCSTWLTVFMATARYLAICHPLHARSIINLHGTRIGIALILVGSVLLNLPQFWQYALVPKQCAEYCTCYSKTGGALVKRPRLDYAYKVVWAVLGTFIPVAVLAFCNCCLIRALRQSLRMQRRYRANAPPRDSGHHITPTLITIVVLFIVLVVPSEILKFIKLVMLAPGASSAANFHMYQAATVVTNFMQACNFAVNFVLYCVINVHFRQTIQYVLCCRWTRWRGGPESRIGSRMRPGYYTKANQSTTNPTYVTDIETEM